MTRTKTKAPEIVFMPQPRYSGILSDEFWSAVTDLSDSDVVYSLAVILKDVEKLTLTFLRDAQWRDANTTTPKRRTRKKETQDVPSDHSQNPDSTPPQR